MTLGDLEDFLRHVEVGVHLLRVVELLERFDEAEHLARLLALDPDRAGRPHRDLGVADRQLRAFKRPLHGLEAAGSRIHGHERAVRFDILGAGVDRHERDLIDVAAARVDLDDALLFEDPLDRAGLAELAVVSRERRPDLRGRAVAIVGRSLDHDRYAAGAVALVDDALELRALAAARRPIDRALDVGERHVHPARPVDGEAQPEIRIRIAPALAGGEHDLAGHLREDGAAFRVRGAFLALDLRPLRVTRHGTA